MRRYNIVVPKEDGGVELYRTRDWLRHHPEISRVDPGDFNASQLSNRLRHLNWRVQETPGEVRLLPPGTPETALIF
jgi:hypothetical protein